MGGEGRYYLHSSALGGVGIPPLLCIFSLGEYPQGRRMISLAHSCLWISGSIISYLREP